MRRDMRRLPSAIAGRRRERGAAGVCMLLVILVMLAAALGIARFGKSSGDYVRRQVTADAAVLAGAEVLAERLRHIGRLQKLGQEALEAEEMEEARRAAQAAWSIAVRSPEAVQSEILRVATGNGASRCVVRGLPAASAVPNEWFVDIPSEEPRVKWVGLAPGFRDRRLLAAVTQDRQAGSCAWVDPGGAWPSGPVATAAWSGRRAGEPEEEP